MTSSDVPSKKILAKADFDPATRLLIFVLTCVNFTHLMDFVIMMPLGPQLMRIFLIDAQKFSMVVSSYTFSAAAAGLLGAFFIDRFDRRRALLFLYAGFAMGTLFCAVAPTYEFLIAARITAGAFGGLVTSLIFAIIGDAVAPEHRGHASGIVMSAFAVASVAGVPTGLYIATFWGWHSPFLLLGSMAGVVWLIAYLKLPTMTRHLAEALKKDPIKEFRVVLSRANHLRSFTITCAMSLGAFSIIPFMSAYLVKNVGFTEAQLPLTYLCGGLTTFVTSRTIGKLADIYGKHRMFYIVAGASTVPLFLVTHLQPSPLWLVLVVTTLFMVLVSGRFVPLMALITSSTTPEFRGAFMSINGAVQQMTSGFAALLGGWVIVTTENGTLLNYDWLGWLGITMTLISLWLASRIETVDTAPVPALKEV